MGFYLGYNALKIKLYFLRSEKKGALHLRHKYLRKYGTDLGLVYGFRNFNFLRRNKYFNEILSGFGKSVQLAAKHGDPHMEMSLFREKWANLNN